MSKNFSEFLKTQKFYLIKLYITERCNLDCDYCYYKERGFVDINLQDACKFLELIPPENINGFVLSGGEAMLKWDILRDLISFIREKHNFSGEIILQTNGLLIKDEHLLFFKRKNIALEFGFDGGGDSTIKHRIGLNKLSHQKVLENIKKARDMGIKYYITMTVFPHEADKVYQNFEFLWSNDLKNIDICTAIFELWEKEQIEKAKHDLLRIIQKLHGEGSNKISNEFSQPVNQQTIIIMLPTGDISLNYFIMALPTEARPHHRIAQIKNGKIHLFEETLKASIDIYENLCKNKNLTYKDILISSAELSYPEIKQKRGDLKFENWKDFANFKQKSEKLLAVLSKHNKPQELSLASPYIFSKT